MANPSMASTFAPVLGIFFLDAPLGLKICRHSSVSQWTLPSSSSLLLCLICLKDTLVLHFSDRIFQF